MKMMMMMMIGKKEWKSRDSEVTTPVRDDAQMSAISKSDGPDGDFVTAEVLFTEVRPQTGQFELIPSDSDEQTSSESGTPVPHRIKLVREELQGDGTVLSSARAGSLSPMKLVEVRDVKSSEASQWRKEVMQGQHCNFVVLFINERVS